VLDTVLTDQLSRFSLSDPNQTESLTLRAQQSPLKTIYTTQGNKYTLVDRQQNKQKDVLAKRCKFNCRVRSNNGKLALRELFGLFFVSDGSLTVYEFRQYSNGMVAKKSNALPFVNRKRYENAFGRRKRLPINVFDLFRGSVIYVPVDQSFMNLPEHLIKGLEYLELEVTQVDEAEKENMLVAEQLAQQGPSADQLVVVAQIKARLAQTFSNEQVNDAKVVFFFIFSTLSEIVRN
jgi:hypothetical protein